MDVSGTLSENKAGEGSVNEAAVNTENIPVLKGKSMMKLAAKASVPIGSVTINSVSASTSATVVNNAITYTVNFVHSTDNYRLLYTWYKNGTTVSSAYMSGNTVTLTPTQAGSYSLKVEAQNLDITSGSQWQSQGTSSSTYVAASAFNYSALNVNYTEIALGSNLTFTPAVNGGSGQYAYSYKIYKNAVEVTTVSEAEGKSSFTYIPTTQGSYYCVATVRDKVFNESATQTSSTVTVSAGLLINTITTSDVLVTSGTAVTITANATGGSGTITYDYYLYKNGSEFSVTTASSSNVYSFTPATNGDYQLYVQAKDGKGNTAEATSAVVKVVTALSVNSVTASPSKPSINSPVTFTANVSGTPSSYFWEIQLGTAVVKTQTTTAKTLTYTPTAAGTYVVKVTALLEHGGKEMKAQGQSGNIVIGSSLSLNGVSVSPSTAIYLGKKVTFTAELTGGTENKLYVYRIYRNGTQVSVYSSTSNKYEYTPSALGTYECEVGVKDDNHEYYTYATSDEFEVIEPLRITAVTPSATKVSLGSVVTFTPVVGGGDGSYKYIYCVFNETKQLTMDSSTASSYTYKPSAQGKYYCTVYVTDKTNTWISLSSQKIDVVSSIAMVTSTVDKSAVYTNETVTVTAGVVGGASSYAYRVYDSKGNVVAGQIYNSSTYSFALSTAGKYTVTTQVWDGVHWYSAANQTVTVYNPFKYTTVYMDRLGGTVGDTIHVSTDASNGIPSIQYIFCVFNGSTQLTMDYSSTNSYAYTFTQPGVYRIDVYATDGKGQWVVNSRQGITVTGTSPLAITDIKVSKAYASVGDAINYTTFATGGVNTYIYCVFRNGQQLTMTYSSSPNFSYTIPSGGDYTITVYASDGVSWVNKTASVTTSVSGSSFNIISVNADSASKEVGESITFTATPSGGSGTIQYIHCVFRGSTQLTMTYSSSPKFIYTPNAAGHYHIDVYGTDSSGVWVKASSSEVLVGEEISKLGLYISTSATDLSVGDVVTVTSSAWGGVGPYEYIYCLFRDGTQLTMNRGPSDYYMYELNSTGTYRVDVYCGDTKGNWIMQQSAVISVH